MSKYGDSNWEKEDLFNDMREFLKNHKVFELLEVVKDAVEYHEEGY